MDRGVRIAAACGVLLGGTALGLLFRRPSSCPERPLSPRGDQLVLRKQIPPGASELSVPRRGRPGEPSPSSTAVAPARQAAQVLTPSDPGEPPPDLAEAYPQAGRPEVRCPWSWMGWDLPRPRHAEGAARTHRVTDGDSLQALAERYLGSADRYLEIYEANRDVLTSPQLLPIGAELRIPPRDAPPSVASHLLPQAPLVPVRPTDP